MSALDARISDVGACLTNVYHRSGRAIALTVFLVQEKARALPGKDQPEQLVWGLPMGSYRLSPGADVADQASNELDEELHFPISAARMRDPSAFRRVDVPHDAHMSASKSSTFFVSLQPGEGGCGHYTRAEFQHRRVARKALVDAGQLPHCYKVTKAMTHVPVANLLHAQCAATGRCLDIDGNELVLRDVLWTSVLRNEAFRAALGEVLGAYAQRRRAGACNFCAFVRHEQLCKCRCQWRLWSQRRWCIDSLGATGLASAWCTASAWRSRCWFRCFCQCCGRRRH